MTLRIGIDVGGTFTDVTAFDDRSGEIVVSKYLSDPAAPVRVMETITAELAEKHGADAVSLVLHGSTAALNTLLEGKGVRAGLLDHARLPRRLRDRPPSGVATTCSTFSRPRPRCCSPATASTRSANGSTRAAR